MLLSHDTHNVFNPEAFGSMKETNTSKSPLFQDEISDNLR